MTVAELIAKLSGFDPDALVMTFDGHAFGYDDIPEPYLDKDNHVIFKL